MSALASESSHTVKALIDVWLNQSVIDSAVASRGFIYGTSGAGVGLELG